MSPRANTVVVITGGSAGIGAALAERMATDGASVAIMARRADALAAVAARCAGPAFSIVGDMTLREDVRRAVEAAIAHFGHVDVWVNNVGRGITRLPSDLTDEDVDDMVRVNIKTVLYGMQEILPHFKARGTGHIINVSSLLGRMPLAPFRSAYSAAKHFVNSLTHDFRTEVAQTHPGIQVSLVSPGVVRTDFGLNARHGGPDSRKLPDSQSPEEVADVIASLIASPRPDIYTRPGARERVMAHYAATGEDP